MKVLGLDLSLRASGFADESGVSVFRVKDIRGSKRLAVIRDEVARRVLGQDPPLVVLEGYSYASKGASIIDIGELGGVIRLLLWESSVPTVFVAPALLKRFSTSKGNVGKPEMLDAAIRRWHYEGSPDDNAVDAFLLRAMGLVALGDLDAPGYARGVVEKVKWPELVSS